MHHTLAMSSTEHNLWTIANILGLVVVVAVAALLSLLIYLVKIIDRRVVAVRDTLKAAAANTADTVLIPQVANGVEAVLAEGLQHHLFLGRVLGKVEIMTGLVVWTVIDVLLLIAGLAFYLFWVGTLLTRIAGNLEECAETVRTIVGHAKLIGPGVEHINETGGVVAGALPLLYGMAEGIVTGVTPRPEEPAVPERPARPRAPAAPASWTPWASGRSPKPSVPAIAAAGWLAVPRCPADCGRERDCPAAAS